MFSFSSGSLGHPGLNWGMAFLQPFPDSILARQGFPKPSGPSLLFPSKEACPFLSLSPVAPLAEDPRRLCIEERAAYQCLKTAYPHLSKDDYRWWRYHHGFESVVSTASDNGGQTTITTSYLGFTQEEWDVYNEGIRQQPKLASSQATVSPRRRVGRPAKGSEFPVMPAPRRAGHYIQSVYDALPLKFTLVDSPQDLLTPGSACPWQGDTRRLTMVESVVELLTQAISHKHLALTGKDPTRKQPVTHADALSWLHLHGFSRHAVSVVGAAKQITYSAPTSLFIHMESEVSSNTSRSSESTLSLGHPGPRTLDPDGILMECD